MRGGGEGGGLEALGVGLVCGLDVAEPGLAVDTTCDEIRTDEVPAQAALKSWKTLFLSARAILA